MSSVVNSLIPIFALFVLGFLTKKINIFTEHSAEMFLKLVFYISLPAVILQALPSIELTVDLLILPIIAILTILITIFCAFVVSRELDLDNSKIGVFLISSMIMNTGFNLPFILAFLEEEGVALASIFDIGNSILTLTLAYSLAVFYGDNDRSNNDNERILQHHLISKLLTSPPIWALAIGILINLTGLSYHPAISNLIAMVANLLTPLVIISLGIYFEPKLLQDKSLYIPVIIRIGVGFVIGLVVTSLIDYSSLLEKIIIIGCAAPIGFNTLTFSSLENLDNEYAANIVSIGIILGMIYIPALLIIL